MRVKIQVPAPAYECSCGQRKDAEDALYEHMRRCNEEAATSFRHYRVN